MLSLVTVGQAVQSSVAAPSFNLILLSPNAQTRARRGDGFRRRTSLIQRSYCGNLIRLLDKDCPALSVAREITRRLCLTKVSATAMLFVKKKCVW